MRHDPNCSDCVLLALERDDAVEKTVTQEELFKEAPNEENFSRLNIRKQFEVQRSRRYVEHLKTH